MSRRLICLRSELGMCGMRAVGHSLRMEVGVGGNMADGCGKVYTTHPPPKLTLLALRLPQSLPPTFLPISYLSATHPVAHFHTLLRTTHPSHTLYIPGAHFPTFPTLCLSALPSFYHPHILLAPTQPFSSLQ